MMDYIKKVNKKLDQQLDPYELLANAVIFQVCQDYRQQLKIIRDDPNNAVPYARSLAIKCLNFFHSKQFSIYTNIEPEYLIRKLEEEQQCFFSKQYKI